MVYFELSVNNFNVNIWYILTPKMSRSISTVLLVLFKTRSHRINSFGNIMASSLATSDIMASALTTNAVNSVFEPRSGQIKDNKIGSCCFSTKHAP